VAQYSIETGPLNEAGEDFSVLAIELDKYRDRIGSVLSQWQEGLPELQRQLAGAMESTLNISRNARTLGLVLYEIIDCYIQAERTASSGYDQDLSMPSAPSGHALLPNVRKSTGFVPLERTVLPDWLQIAVLEYEQSQS
jgi:hypothetical protein